MYTFVTLFSFRINRSSIAYSVPLCSLCKQMDNIFI